MSDSTTYNLLKDTDMRIHAAADVRTTSGASPILGHANGGKHSNDSSGLHVTDGNSGANRNTGFAFMISTSALGLVPGETYVFSAELSSLSTNGESNGLQVYQHNNSDQWWTGKRSYASWASGAGTYHVSFKYDGSAYIYLLFSVGVGGSATVIRFGLYHAPSAAWAPAEGESLTGGYSHEC